MTEEISPLERCRLQTMANIAAEERMQQIISNLNVVASSRHTISMQFWLSAADFAVHDVFGLVPDKR